jgi:hypothetical protein
MLFVLRSTVIATNPSPRTLREGRAAVIVFDFGEHLKAQLNDQDFVERFRAGGKMSQSTTASDCL